MASIFSLEDEGSSREFLGAVCAFGVFDGVHLGHQYLLNCAKEEARIRDARFVVLTFDIDPDERFAPARLKKLMSNEARLNHLALYADEVAVLPFTEKLSSSQPLEFLSCTFKQGIPASLHVGTDFHFGFKAQGGVKDLRSWAKGRGVEVHAHDLLEEEGKPITATRIRSLLASGAVEKANELLGHPYAVSGEVYVGRGEGADMGFRTANLAIGDSLRALGDGVYAAYALVDGRRYKAAVNMGVAASFADRSTATCEAHLLDFSGDLYGKSIELQFTHWLRPMRKFDDIDELIATVKGNIDWVRKNL